MAAPYRVSLRVRRKHFDAIEAGLKLVEIRRRSPYWEARLERVRLHGVRAIAVFTSGARGHRRWIASVKVGYARQFLGRPLSEEGRRDVGDGLVYAIFLGKEVDEAYGRCDK